MRASALKDVDFWRMLLLVDATLRSGGRGAERSAGLRRELTLRGFVRNKNVVRLRTKSRGRASASTASARACARRGRGRRGRAF